MGNLIDLPDLPNLWLVGYGLDDDGTKRGWTELFAKPKAPGIPLVAEDAIFKDGAEGESAYKAVRADILARVRGGGN